MSSKELTLWKGLDLTISTLEGASFLDPNQTFIAPSTSAAKPASASGSIGRVRLKAEQAGTFDLAAFVLSVAEAATNTTAVRCYKAKDLRPSIDSPPLRRVWTDQATDQVVVTTCHSERLAIRFRLSEARVATPPLPAYSYRASPYLDILDSSTPPLDLTEQQPLVERFESLLSKLRTSLPNKTFLALQKQLRSLLADESDLDEAGVSPSVISFQGLLYFFRWNHVEHHPSISLDRNGNFVASWGASGVSKLSLIFTGLTDGRWLAVDRSSGKIDKAAGKLSSDIRASIPERFHGWIFA